MSGANGTSEGGRDYIQDQSSAMIVGAGEGSGKTFIVIAQDSLGSTEMSSVEELKAPLDPTMKRIQLDGNAYDAGGELFRITINFATNPALAICRMRLTRETAADADATLNGMWHHLRGRMYANQLRAFVWRFSTPIMICMLVVGVIIACACAVLFWQGMYSFACAALAISGLILSYTYFSWQTPHCAFDTINNETLLDRNKWFTRTIITSIVLPIGLRALLHFGFGL